MLLTIIVNSYVSIKLTQYVHHILNFIHWVDLITKLKIEVYISDTLSLQTFLPQQWLHCWTVTSTAEYIIHCFPDTFIQQHNSTNRDTHFNCLFEFHNNCLWISYLSFLQYFVAHYDSLLRNENVKPKHENIKNPVALIAVSFYLSHKTFV